MHTIGDGAQSRHECLGLSSNRRRDCSHTDGFSEKFCLFNEVAKVARKSIIDFVSIIDCRQRWIPSVQPSPVPFRVEASPVNWALAKARWDEEQAMHQNLVDLPTFSTKAKFIFFDGVALMSPSRSSSECRPLLLSLRGCGRLLGKTILDQAESLGALIYLDLSHTKVGGSRDYYLDLSLFPSLRILKMQEAGLRDFELRQILSTCTIRLQLSSLDIRDNELTDDALADIGQYLAPGLNIAKPDENTEKTSYFEDPPMYRERSRTDEELEDAPETHDAPLDSPEAFMKYVKAHKNEVDLVQRTGLTAIYLSGNSFTSDTFLRLFRLCDCLQIVDLDCEFRVTRYSKELSQDRTHPDMKDSAVPPAVYLLSPQNSRRLEILRIHHSLVTHVPSLHSWIKEREEAQDEAYLDRLFADASSHGYNLGAQYLLPDVNPRLHTLTLTGLPTSCDPCLLSRLTAFLRAASAQESAIERACSSVSRRRGAQVLRGLRVLRLELDDDRGVGPSVSGDRDADEFVARSAEDFSFFEEEKREKGAGRRVPLKEGLRRYRMETLRDLNAVRESLGGVPEWRVRRGAPHYHWSGRLEVVSKQA